MDLASFALGLTDFESASALYCPCGKSSPPCIACDTAPGTPPALDVTCVLLEIQIDPHELPATVTFSTVCK